MGYTHYWNRPQIIDSDTFETIRQDFLQVLPALEAAGSPLGDLYGRWEPILTRDLIGFNGVACCGHASNPNVRIPWPAKDAHGIGSNAGIGGTLPYRACNGDCSYESLYFPRSLEPDTIVGFCKTAFRPYDLAVTTFLTIAKHHLGDRIVVQTDGEPQHWADAFSLCQACLGYGSRASFHDGKLVACRIKRHTFHHAIWHRTPIWVWDHRVPDTADPVCPSVLLVFTDSEPSTGPEVCHLF